MKIGIEAQRLFRKKKHGMDIVVLELIRNLQKIDKENDYVIFVKPDVDRNCIKETDNFKIIELSGGIYPMWEQFALPKAAEKEKCDILHCTSNTAPIKSKIPLVVTLHDIIYMESLNFLNKGGTLYQKFGNLYRRLIVPRVVKKCKKLITVSHFEKNRIAEFFDQKNGKLQAVYNGVGKHFTKIEDEKELLRVKNKYNLPKKFIFFLGNTDPKKNTVGVLKAYSKYLKISDEKIPLVMLDFGKKALNDFLIEAGATDIIDNIKLTGYIENTDLPAIYSQCSLFLYPSLRESFGIPLLEAMACGAPVITSNTSSMPEISGGAASIINPFKSDEITYAIVEIFDNHTYRNQLIEKGFKQAKKFSWKAMATDVLKIYNEVI